MTKIITYQPFINLSVVILFLMATVSCKNGGTQKNLTPEKILHQQQNALTQVIVYDVFTPPVASRIYAYTSLASYEALRFFKTGEPSLAEKMNGFGSMPVPEAEKDYDFLLAAHKAFFTVVHKVVFSLDSLKVFENGIDQQYKDALTEEVYVNSVSFGNAVGAAILARAGKDNYSQSRGKPKYLGSNEPGMWRPTPPDYLDGVEFCWNELKPLLLDSASQFLSPPPPPHSTDTATEFLRQAKEVYNISKKLTQEQKEIAMFWDDNPFVIQHSGHMLMANKKITPAGHWMGIAGIASKMKKDDVVKIAKTYALTASTLFEAFISCWDTKYKWQYIRPVTVINEFIDKTWTPLLQTPPFPEYPSGHSSITAAAATVLTKIYGDNFAFQDTSNLRYIGIQRQFSSFLMASEETSISRFYGGIHFKMSVDMGATVGRQIGNYIIQKTGL